ncbi:MAG: ATP-dependent RNA helicase HrpA [Deltaproteobacteria bacterium]|nr:ATP-dependent RNA helicase HrpA [Deltaproteobacteria bacterium]
MRVDRCTIIRELRLIGEQHKNSKADTTTLELLNSINQRLNQSIRKKARRQSHIPKITYPQSLPILQKKDDIIESIKRHQVTVITGETGSGKTTQIPKMCMEAGRGIDGIIGCTQPRRIAAVTVSQRIAEELNQELGMAVGYKIRFDDTSSRKNYIKIMTDGVLLMETQNDPDLNEYDTIIVDEAHERSINIDFILGILKKLLVKRRDLKLIITSATLDTEKFSRAFHNAPIIEVSGRLYPVEVRYAPTYQKNERDDISYIDEAVHAVSSLNKEKRRGDILLFMPTEQDIRETCDVLAAKHYKHTQVLPLFARLSAAEQRRVFMPTEAQKIVVATNVAETSITIPGIKYVIDTGLARISEYNPRTRTKSLPIKAISRSSADQRMGRCGRVQDGICIRLYEEDDYENRHIFTSPEILRSNLAEVILRMIALKLGDISSFPFIDPPGPKNIKDGFDILEELDAIRSEKMKKGKGVVFSLTPKGRMMARLPIDPRISRMIIEAQKEGCVNEILIIASVLSSQDPRERPFEQEVQADEMHKSFVNPSSDFITLLNIWTTYHDAWKTMKTQNKMRRFCKKQYLSYRRMREWKDIYGQLSTILQEEGIQGKKTRSLEGESLYTAIHKSILSGYLSNIAVKDEKNIYKKAKGKDIMIFPGSGLFNRGGDWIVAAELIETSRLFARTVATIKSEWLEEIGANLCRYTYSNPRWDKKRGEVVATEQVSLFGLIIVPGRSVSYGRINPREATEVFIRRALVEGEMTESLPFLTHNQGLIRKITTMEDKIRKRDILVSEEDLVKFYETHLSNIYDIRTLRKLIKDRGGDDFLTMREEDVINYYPGETLSLYPDEVSLGNTCLPCTYRFDPAMPDDGITVKIPASIATSVSLESADWLVPGLREEKISALIKGLPKQYRKKLVPLSATIATICSGITHEEGPLAGSLGTFIHARFGIDIPATAWPHETLPDHLKMRFAVTDEKGDEIFASRNVRELTQRFADEIESPAFAKAQSIWEKEGIDTWDFGTLPESINLKSYGGLDSFAFPALTVEDGSISIRLFQDRKDAEYAHREGTIALFERHFKKEMHYLRKTLTLEGNGKTWAHYFGGAKKVEAALYRKALSLLFDRPVRSQEAFFAHAASAKRHILPTGQDTLREIEPVLKAYDETRSTLHSLEVTHRSIKPIVTFIKSLRDDLNRLVPQSFLDLYDSDRLLHMPRYLKAIVIRVQRGIAHLEKDEGKFREVKIFEDYLRDFRNSEASYTSEIRKKAVDEFAWMVEEYKVSLFAQELKTPVPVSRKRLENRVREIERMV